MQITYYLVVCFSYFFSNNLFSSYQEQLIEEMMMAEPGSVIYIPEGVYEFDQQLWLDVEHVTIKGKGTDKSILSFKNQRDGAEGLLVTSNYSHLEGFTILDPKGDGVKLNGVRGVTIKNIKVCWSNGSSVHNGGYGIYPVRSRDILIEGSEVCGASDAGIYVGQSQNIIVRQNFAHLNVAGIEVENSIDADVYGNYVTKNSGGILVFNLPDLEVVGKKIRIFNNTLASNNIDNFAYPGNVVAEVPRGSGLIVMAGKKIEIFDNLFVNNKTANIILYSYKAMSRPILDESYDPYVESVYLYDNVYINGGENPKGGSSSASKELIAYIASLLGTPIPNVLYGGDVNPLHLDDQGFPLAQYKICIRENPNMSFVNLDIGNDFRTISRDLTSYRCEHGKLSKVILPDQAF